MTRTAAISTGRNAAVTFGKTFVVFRLRAWPPDVFSVIAVDRGLPPEADRFEELAPPGQEPEPLPAPEPQGSLF